MTIMEASLKNNLRSKTPAHPEKTILSDRECEMHEKMPEMMRVKVGTGRAGQDSIAPSRKKEHLILFALILALLAMVIVLMPLAQLPGGASWYVVLMGVLFTSSTAWMLA
jgi:hypothetical protein